MNKRSIFLLVLSFSFLAILWIHKILCRVNFANLQKIEFYVFYLGELAATWSASYTLKVAALIIANFNFASEAKRKEKTQKTQNLN